MVGGVSSVGHRRSGSPQILCGMYAYLLGLFFILSTACGQNLNITIGMTLSLTHYLGPTAQQALSSKAVYDGLLLWHRNLPSEGIKIGNQTYKVNLDIRDDNGNATLVSWHYASMVANSSINFLFAPVGTTLTLRARAVTEPAQRLLIVAAAGGKSVYQNGSWTFQSAGSAPYYVRGIVPTMRIKAATSIAFVYDPVGTFCADMVFNQETFLSDQKIAIKGLWSTFPTLGMAVSDSDLAANMSRIAGEVKNANPDVVFGCMSSGAYQEALIRGLRSVDWLPKMLVVVPDYPKHFATVDNFTSNYVISLPAFVAEATFPHSGVNFNDSKAFAKLFRDTYGYEAESFSALGAQQGILLQNALQRAGSLNQAAVRDAVRLTDLESFLGRTTFNVDGSNNLQLLMYQRINNTGIIVSPPLLANGEVVYPMPLWSERIFSREVGEPVEIAVIVVTSIGIFISLLLFIPLIMYWNHPIIVAAAPTFLSSILVGTVLLYLSNYASLLNLKTVASCHIGPWLLSLGFIITFGSLFAKSWRVWRLYHNKSMSIIKISDLQVMSILGIFIGIMVILLIILSAAGAPRPVYVSLDPHRPYRDYYICGPGNETAFNVFLALILGYGLAIIIVGVVVSFKVRQVPIAIFDESKSINFVVYNVSFFSVLLASLRLSKVGSREALFVVQSVGIIVCVIVTVLSIFVSRFAKIWSQKKKAEQESTDAPSRGGPLSNDNLVSLSTYLNANKGSERVETPSMMAIHGSVASADAARGRSYYEDDEATEKKIEKLEKKLRRREKRIAKLESFINDHGFDVPT
eukprot:TRINITY_DN4505_c0_g1_i1.p1 TRINITY_DN4505_c0_g1~~TRINITY_DN4505_c0_g1_i1.p1  ORF type:complete len:803 (+),score=109.75 TRINITY_DN4505_c0_g1_i1:133-2541(+)